jgi:hypothetical protein
VNTERQNEGETKENEEYKAERQITKKTHHGTTKKEIVG